jgi:hypothetical protein
MWINLLLNMVAYETSFAAIIANELSGFKGVS